METTKHVFISWEMLKEKEHLLHKRRFPHGEPSMRKNNASLRWDRAQQRVSNHRHRRRKRLLIKLFFQGKTVDKSKKLSGKQLFEKDSSLNTSDMAFDGMCLSFFFFFFCFDCNYYDETTNSRSFLLLHFYRSWWVDVIFVLDWFEGFKGSSIINVRWLISPIASWQFLCRTYLYWMNYIFFLNYSVLLSSKTCCGAH